MQPYPVDAEFDFLVRCIARQPQIETIPDLDLDRLYRMASDHDVVPLLYRGLRVIGEPAALLDQLGEEITKRALFYEIILPQHLAELLAGLQAVEVPTLLLKGYALGVEIYQQPVMRPFIDYDLLIHPDDGYKAAQVLAALGYQPASHIKLPAEHHHLVPYVHPERLMVELHSELVTAQGAVHIDMAQIWAESLPWEVQGVPTRILCLEHSLIYLALHAVMTHQFEQGLKVMCDVHELLVSRTVDWDRVVATSHDWGCARQLYLTLRLLNELYGEIVTPQYLPAPERSGHYAAATGIQPAEPAPDRGDWSERFLWSGRSLVRPDSLPAVPAYPEPFLSGSADHYAPLSPVRPGLAPVVLLSTLAEHAHPAPSAHGLVPAAGRPGYARKRPARIDPPRSAGLGDSGLSRHYLLIITLTRLFRLLSSLMAPSSTILIILTMMPPRIAVPRPST